MARASIVCIAYFFPPASVSGVHRTRAIVRHLPAFGWRPVVVTARENQAGGQDQTLLSGLPHDLVVYRNPAPNLLALANRVRTNIKRMTLPFSASNDSSGEPSVRHGGHVPRQSWIDKASWWIQIPDQVVGWLPTGLYSVLHAVQRHQASALYSSAPYWTAHLIGLLARQITGLPWIADFRDPWRANPFRRLGYQSVDRFDAWLERQVVEHADRVVCNSDYVRDDFVSRFPHRRDRIITIPNGFDPEDYVDLVSRRPVGRDHLVLTHAGVFYGPRHPGPVFRAIRLLRDQGRFSRTPCVQLIGPPTYEGRCLKSMAAEHGIEENVVVRGEVPHRQALEALRGSDIQLLVGFDGEGSELQVPAKLFEYLGVGRPILALAPRRSAIADVVKHGGLPGEICGPDNPQEIAEAILRLGTKSSGSLGCEDEPRGPANSRFHRREQVGQLAELLENALHEHDIEDRP